MSMLAGAADFPYNQNSAKHFGASDMRVHLLEDNLGDCSNSSEHRSQQQEEAAGCRGPDGAAGSVLTPHVGPHVSLILEWTPRARPGAEPVPLPVQRHLDLLKRGGIRQARVQLRVPVNPLVQRPPDMVIALLPPSGSVAPLLQATRKGASAVASLIERHLDRLKRRRGGHPRVGTAVRIDAASHCVRHVVVALFAGLRRVTDVEGQRGRGLVKWEGAIRPNEIGIFADKHIQTEGTTGRHSRSVQRHTEAHSNTLGRAVPDAREQRVCVLVGATNGVGDNLLRDRP
mmetsp:Transcript_59749/g.174687  ORF Transcript_59749/g.174687 Transcript_59749/m.174687 type:complete len:287 (+) Transcript_59749:129-989(+)